MTQILKPVKIKSIKNIGFQETYDLTTKKNHNFFVNWILTHNSHSASYGLLAWIQAYYKANYPLEFYVWMLQTLEQVSGKVRYWEKDKVYQLLRDYQAHWYELIFPNINDSKVTFEFAQGKKWEGCIVWFSYIQGIGEKQAEEIVRKQPFTSYADFISRIDRRVVNSKVLKILKDLWLFNTIWWAPLVSEDLVEELNFVDEITDLLWYIIKLSEGIISSELYEILKVEELENNEVTDAFYKKCISKLNSKLKSLWLRFTKKPELYKEDKVFNIEKIKKEIALIWNWAELICKQFKKPVHRRTPFDMIDKREENYTYYQNLAENEEITNREGKVYIRCFTSYFKYLRDRILKMIDKLDVDTEPQVITPSHSILLKYCPILLNVDLSKYVPIVPKLKNFLPLTQINFNSPDQQRGTTIWALFDKSVMPDIIVDWKVNWRKSKIRWNLMVRDQKIPIFINQSTYLKYQELLDNIESWTVLLCSFTRSPWFNLLQISHIALADEFYLAMQGQRPWSEQLKHFHNTF